MKTEEGVGSHMLHQQVCRRKGKCELMKATSKKRLNSEVDKEQYLLLTAIILYSTSGGVIRTLNDRAQTAPLSNEGKLASASALAPPPTSITRMAFAGRWETENQEGYDEFCKLLGIPDDIIEKGRNYKLITEVTQDGETFSWTQIYPTNAKVTNTFTIGKECDMETIGGKKFKATVHLEGGKLSVTFPNYHHTSEISGGKLIEVTGHNRDRCSC
ncbi:Gastrotropin [Takifugu flavidus]|uniref:Gastrotropin n=1 Tax=Takifugu flavidus TaxID=433684 RepID=A0A5C6P3J1_9TELE|nr:Gastrotropin [Takifugu flavidus]